MNRAFWLTVVLCAGLLLGMVPARASKMSDLEDLVLSLKARVDQVEKREETLRTDIASDNQKLVMDLKKNQADIKTDLMDIHQELSQIEEMIKEINQRMSDLEGKMTMTPQQGATPTTTIASTEQLGGPPAPPSQPPPQAETPAAVEKKKTAKEAYDLGVQLYADGRWDAARSQFEASVKISPDSATAEDAQFRIAECYYQQRDFKRAIIEYDKFQQKYPRSKRMPAVLLRMGLSFEKLGRKDVAATTFKDLIASYPKSQEAQQAKAQLEKM
jgi:tol-pal system protein YbgF